MITVNDDYISLLEYTEQLKDFNNYIRLAEDLAGIWDKDNASDVSIYLHSDFKLRTYPVLNKTRARVRVNIKRLSKKDITDITYINDPKPEKIKIAAKYLVNYLRPKFIEVLPKMLEIYIPYSEMDNRDKLSLGYSSIDPVSFTVEESDEILALLKEEPNDYRKNKHISPYFFDYSDDEFKMKYLKDLYYINSNDFMKFIRNILSKGYSIKKELLDFILEEISNRRSVSYFKDRTLQSELSDYFKIYSKLGYVMPGYDAVYVGSPYSSPSDELMSLKAINNIYYFVNYKNIGNIGSSDTTMMEVFNLLRRVNENVIVEDVFYKAASYMNDLKKELNGIRSEITNKPINENDQYNLESIKITDRIFKNYDVDDMSNFDAVRRRGDYNYPEFSTGSIIFFRRDKGDSI